MFSLFRNKHLLIAIILIISALAWIFLSLKDNLDQLAASVYLLNPAHLIMSIFPIMVAIIIPSYIYFLLLTRIVPEGLSTKNVVVPYLTSQMVRYLPGKIWGLFYQVQATARWVPAQYTLKANLEQYILANLNVIAVAISVYVYYFKGIAVGLAALVVMLTIFFMVLKSSLLHSIILFFSKSILVGKESYFSRGDGKRELIIFFLFQAEWIVYILACAIILPGNYSIEEVVFIATIYAVAALVGALTLVIPSGLVVREASFVWLSGLFGFEPAAMVTFGIVLRIINIIVEILCAFLAVILLDGKNIKDKIEGKLDAG